MSITVQLILITLTCRTTVLLTAKIKTASMKLLGKVMQLLLNLSPKQKVLGALKENLTRYFKKEINGEKKLKL